MCSEINKLAGPILGYVGRKTCDCCLFLWENEIYLRKRVVVFQELSLKNSDRCSLVILKAYISVICITNKLDFFLFILNRDDFIMMTHQ